LIPDEEHRWNTGEQARHRASEQSGDHPRRIPSAPDLETVSNASMPEV
jgi:hypothetical protein